MLERLLYVSRMTRRMSEVELQVLLGQGQVRNRRLDVTGVLAVCGDYYCQVIEGRPAAVAQVMARVRASSNHWKVRRMLHEAMRQRMFPDSAMDLSVRDDLAEEVAKLHDSPCLSSGDSHRLMIQLVHEENYSAWSLTRRMRVLPAARGGRWN